MDGFYELMNLRISAYSESGKGKQNNDYYGYSAIGIEEYIYRMSRLEMQKDAAKKALSHDKFYEMVPGFIAAVCDGVSNSFHPGEELEDAPEVAVKKFLQMGPVLTCVKNVKADKPGDVVWRQLCDAINQSVLDLVANYSDITMATTMSCVYLDENTLHVFAVGDSPVYRIDKNNRCSIIVDERKPGKLSNYFGKKLKIGRHLDFKLEIKDPLKESEAIIIMSDGVLAPIEHWRGEKREQKINELLSLDDSTHEMAKEIVKRANDLERRLPQNERALDDKTVLVIQSLGNTRILERGNDN